MTAPARAKPPVAETEKFPLSKSESGYEPTSSTYSEVMNPALRPRIGSRPRKKS